MDNNINNRCFSRREVSDRYALPAKTIAQWASKGTGPRYARITRHARYRLSDIIEWETNRVDELLDTARRGVPTPGGVELIAEAGSRATNAGNMRNER